VDGAEDVYTGPVRGDDAAEDISRSTGESQHGVGGFDELGASLHDGVVLENIVVVLTTVLAKSRLRRESFLENFGILENLLCE